MLRKIGAEAILLTMVLPLVVWLVTSIYELRAGYSDIQEVKEDMKIVKRCLINGICKEE